MESIFQNILLFLLVFSFVLLTLRDVLLAKQLFSRVDKLMKTLRELSAKCDNDHFDYHVTRILMLVCEKDWHKACIHVQKASKFVDEDLEDTWSEMTEDFHFVRKNMIPPI